MPTTYETLSVHLRECLNDPAQTVVALTGQWGTGKTHLWLDLARHPETIGLKSPPLYASLFGARTIDEFKLRLLQHGMLDPKSATAKTITHGIKAGQPFLAKLGIDPARIALVAFPLLVKQKLVVVDDVERRHKQLEVDELLGFLDEFSQTTGTRFLLLLNSDKLEGDAHWKTMREKVVTAELTLHPSPAETFDIASGGCQDALYTAVKRLTVLLEIRNIRVLKRILALAARIAKAAAFGEASFGRWLPSTVLFTAATYGVVDNAPSLDELRARSDVAYWMDVRNGRSAEDAARDELLRRVGIVEADRFEDILATYLDTGILDAEALAVLGAEYSSQESAEGVKERRQKFIHAVFFDRTQSNLDLVTTARTFLPNVAQLGPQAISDIVSLTEEVGGGDAAGELLAAWQRYVNDNPSSLGLDRRPIVVGRGPLHPVVMETMQAIRAQLFEPVRLIDAVVMLADGTGHSEPQETALANATPQGYREVLDALVGEPLGKVLYDHLDRIRSGQVEGAIGHALQQFLAACSELVAAEPQGRLAAILRGAFTRKGLVDRL